MESKALAAGSGERDTTALLFPGQGSQEPGMRSVVEEHAPDLLEHACEVVGDDPFERIDEGTVFLQPALFCVCVADLVRLGWSDGELPWCDDVVCAGHSLGEVAALVAAGAFDPLEGLRLVAARGHAMQRAADLRPGGMMALAAAPMEAERIAAQVGAAVANDNAPRQVVLSGSPESLEEGMREARRSGLRAVVLPVPAALHSPTMEPAVIEFSAALATAEVRSPRWPVYSCASARPFDDIRRELAEALVRGVRWRETVHALYRAGARRFVEVGPGRVLTGLVKRTLSDVEAVTSRAPIPVAARG